MAPTPSDSSRPHLSKSRLVAGWKCPGYLWMRVHEPDHELLQPALADRDRMDQGTAAGELATEQFPGGVLIDLPYEQMREKVEATRRALADGARYIFEASFWEDEVFVAVDVLERLEGGGFKLIEVKSSTRVKPEHTPDVAAQLHVLRKAGLQVDEVALMHLNKQYRHPGPEPLFVATDLTAEAEAFLPEVPALIATCHAVLARDVPPRHPDGACPRPLKTCPLADHCWPDDLDHIRQLAGVGPATALDYLERGIHTFADLPADASLNDTATRQLAAWREGGLRVEPGLASDLDRFSGRLGFLDFETVSRAIPLWQGLAPWGKVPVQFSYHERQPDGTLSHEAWLAEGDDDPRPAIARALVEATRDADHVVVYSPFEKQCIRVLERAVPELADELEALKRKLLDLAKVVKRNLAHPAFRGSTSIKAVLTPMVPELSYDEVEIADGMTASVRLHRFMAEGQAWTTDEYEAERQRLLDYCELDTLAMVRLLQSMEELVE